MKLRSLCAVILSALMPMTTLSATTEGAMLQTVGMVSVNSQPASNGMTVMATDRIVTGESGRVQLASSGSSVSLRENSDVTYLGKELKMRHGMAEVYTSRGLGIRIHDVTIAPANTTAKYQVKFADGTYEVASLQGDLMVSGAGHAMLVGNGKSMTSAIGEGQQPEPTGKMPDSSGAGHSTKTVVLWTAAGIAAGFLIGYAAGGGFSSSSGPTSPSTVH